MQNRHSTSPNSRSIGHIQKFLCLFLPSNVENTRHRTLYIAVVPFFSSSKKFFLLKNQCFSFERLTLPLNCRSHPIIVHITMIFLGVFRLL